MLFMRRQWKGPFIKTFAFMAAFALAGDLIFLLIDYLPYRAHYWEFFHSPHMHGITDRYLDLLKSPLGVLWELLKGIWQDSWDTTYHRFMFYFSLNGIALAGGLWLKRPSHKILVFTHLLIFSMLLPVHISPFYFSYFVPFTSLLLASVLIDVWDKVALSKKYFSFRALYRLAFVATILLYASLPVATLWCFRDYDFERLAQQIQHAMDPALNVIAANNFFFVIPRERLYASYLYIDYDLQRLMSELRLSYFIWDTNSTRCTNDTPSSGDCIAKNFALLSQKCRETLTLHDYTPRLVRPNYDGKAIVLFDCRNVF